MRYSSKWEPGIHRFIEANGRILNKLEAMAANCNDNAHKVALIAFGAEFAARNSTGYFFSAGFDCELIKLAKTIPSSRQSSEDCCATGNRGILHVFSRYQEVGGHYRLAKGLVQGLAEKISSDVVFTGFQENARTEDYRGISEDFENIWYLEGDIYEKAAKLRAISLQYEAIVLYTHMNDPLPSLAYGTENFNVPVIAYNHADHVFWIGTFIVDKLLEIRESGREVSARRRGIDMDRSVVLEMPMDSMDMFSSELNDSQILELKKTYGVDEYSKVILSVGRSSKYGEEFVDPMLNILRNRDDVVVLVVGPSIDLPLWKSAYDVSEGRIRALGEISSTSQLSQIYQICDLYIDSMPTAGGFSILHAILLGKPVLTVDTGWPALDFQVPYTVESENLIDEALSRLYRKDVDDSDILFQRDKYRRLHQKEAVAAKFGNIVESLADHKIHWSKQKTGDFEDLDFMLAIGKRGEFNLPNSMMRRLPLAYRLRAFVYILYQAIRVRHYRWAARKFLVILKDIFYGRKSRAIEC